ncbi:AsnC family protein [Streptomyces nigrescens]|uniref:AsnC family protein n=1 Tax=Streptomyces nigrescens TaxID=1920 RepID=UPI0029056A89|nr:AsnC family protein [Streptomyces nigrescens]
MTYGVISVPLRRELTSCVLNRDRLGATPEHALLWLFIGTEQVCLPCCRRCDPGRSICGIPAMTDVSTSESLAIQPGDVRIIRALQVAPRASVSSTAVALGLAEGTINRRYRRLYADGVIRVGGLAGAGQQLAQGRGSLTSMSTPAPPSWSVQRVSRRLAHAGHRGRRQRGGRGRRRSGGLRILRRASRPRPAAHSVVAGLAEPIGQLQGGVDDRLAHLRQDWFGPAVALSVDGGEGAAADKGQDGGSARVPCVSAGVVVAGEDVPGSESSLPRTQRPAIVMMPRSRAGSRGIMTIGIPRHREAAAQ